MDLSVRHRLNYRHLALGRVIAGLLLLNANVPTSSAFVSTPCWASRPATPRLATRLEQFSKSPQLTMVASTPQDLFQEVPVPPKDETFSMVGFWREFKSGAETTLEKAKRYEEFGGETGGIWKTRYLGFIPATALAAPIATPWLTKEEAVGRVAFRYPPSTRAILGERSLANMDHLPYAEHNKVRSVHLESLGSKTVLSHRPLVEAILHKYMTMWRRYAESGEEFRFCEHAKQFTLEVITSCLLGEEDADLLEVLKENMPIISEAILSLPVRLPWPLSRTPLSRIPVLSFSRGLEARDRIVKGLQVVIDQRREAFSAGGAGRERKGMIDAMMALQEKQQEQGGPRENELLLDDAFISDNVITALFAGQDTTSSTLARLLQRISTPEAEGIIDNLVQELTAEEITSPRSGVNGGLLASFPLLFSTFLEQGRMHPPIGGVFRIAKENLNYNGYNIPEGERLVWDLVSGLKSEEIYPKPERFCPFRFLHGNKEKNACPAAAGRNSALAREPDEPGQPTPALFGFGRHICPGKELAKLEIILFLKAFLTEFDYHVVEDQDLSGTVPANFPKDGLKIVLSKKKT